MIYKILFTHHPIRVVDSFPSQYEIISRVFPPPFSALHSFLFLLSILFLYFTFQDSQLLVYTFSKDPFLFTNNH